MEQLNRIELIGYVGSSKSFDIENTHLVRFTLATNLAYIDKNKTPIIETTWHNVVAWDMGDVEKGDKVHIIGRLRSVRYTTEDGNERTNYEVVATSVEKIENDEMLLCEMKKKNIGIKDKFNKDLNIGDEVSFDSGKPRGWRQSAEVYIGKITSWDGKRFVTVKCGDTEYRKMPKTLTKLAA